MKSRFSIVIPNFNGLKLLKKHLPSVVKHSQNQEIIIIDDASNDESVTWIKKTYPQIKVFTNKKNLGFARTVNIGFKKAKNNLVFLLNNDVTININTIPNLLLHFQDPQTFAVGCLENLPNNSRRGKSTLNFQRGMFTHSKSSQLTPGPTAWVFAACGMFQKSIWQKLTGLDPIFSPAYYEDIDISFRAWKSGYTCLFEPKSQVKHQSEATMNQTLNHKKIIVFRNQLLFTWKHMDFSQTVLHLIWLPFHLVITSFRTNFSFFVAFFQALMLVPKIGKPTAKISNQQVLSIFREA